MKRFLPVILIFILILALTITGCGGGGSSSGPPPMTLDMVWVSGGLSFPTDNDYVTMLYGDESKDASNFIKVPYAYNIAITDVTYEQWSTVFTWATTKAANTYTFAHAGVKGSGGSGDPLQPVTTVSWPDAVVWCNALTEYYNANNDAHYECVYTNNGAIVRNSNDDCSNVTAVSTAKGFRLPTNNEWELAARYIGTTKPTVSPLSEEVVPIGGIYWTPGNYASGATANCNNPDATAAVAVCRTNGNNPTSTATVASLAANGLGLYDMSGNIWQMCFDCYPGHSDYRMLRGGCYGEPYTDLNIGGVTQCTLDYTGDSIGFRVVRTQ